MRAPRPLSPPARLLYGDPPSPLEASRDRFADLRSRNAARRQRPCREARAAMTASSFAAALSDTAAAIEALLERLLADDARAGEIARPPRLVAAMRHAVLGGGKRLRPFLAVETARLLGRAATARCAPARRSSFCTGYSLVHDDLPSMDDDDLRRGKPTVHRAFDEATAILAGDALQTLAFEVLADPATDADGAVRSRSRARARPRRRARRHGRRPDARPCGGGPLRRCRSRRGGRAPAPGDEDRGHPRLLGRGRRYPRPRLTRAPARSPRLRPGARRGLPGRRRHPRPRGLHRRARQAHRQGPGEGQGDPRRHPRPRRRACGMPPPRRRGRSRPGGIRARGRSLARGGPLHGRAQGLI